MTGPNGTGKTNLYKALQLAHACGTGTLARRIALEGGMSSVTWAGDRRGEPKIDLDIHLDDFSYAIRLGTLARGFADRVHAAIPFPLDPIVVSERLYAYPSPSRPIEMMERVGTTGFLRDEEGRRISFPAAFKESEPVLTQLLDPRRFPELIDVREQLASMRFHHQLRTDDLAPARQPAVGTRTFAVADDGADLASALQTVRSDGDGGALDRTVADAFEGARAEIIEDDFGRLELQLNLRGNLRRPLRAAELSDGQLRYLFLVAALLAPRPASVVVLNEPEASLHPLLLGPLADLVEVASENVQIVVTTHADELVDRLLKQDGAAAVRLKLSNGATTLS